MNDPLILSSSPHINSRETIPSLMLHVCLALLPAILIGIYSFGLDALWIILVSIVFSLLFEAATQKLMKRPLSILDGSALVTAILLALNLPPTIPLWMVIIGAFFAIVIGKQVYGGLGHNPFNPALVGRVVLLISFPAQMTRWAFPSHPIFSRAAADALSGATPLGWVKTHLMSHGQLPSVLPFNLQQLFLGQSGGCIGEISALALLIGGIYLTWKKIIPWVIPLAFIGTTFFITSLFWLISPGHFINPLYHLFSGGLFLGAIFMATDLVTTPVTRAGMILFGIGCGALTAVIRLFGGYPEGVSFAILLMNAVTPLLDRWTRPKIFGEVRKS